MRTPQIFALLAATVFAPISLAQMRTSTISMPGVVAPTGFARSIISSTGRPHSFGPREILLGAPFLYADYPDQPSAVQPPPQIVILQPSTAVATPPETRPEPLLIELQGNRYVRFDGKQQSVGRGTNAPPDYAEEQSHTSSRITPTQPPTILIFRDGHREQVPEYAIIGTTLYASGDYWQSGRWTKNVQLSSLNLPATVQANRDAGIKFTLPSAPNEVVTRP